MATNPYFTLEDSAASVTRRFRVLANGFSNILDKAQSIERTIDGDLDISVGSVKEKFSFTVRVRYEEPADGDPYLDDWGTLADLKYFYSLNNPNGSPSNEITFTDHYETQKTVIMAGDFNSQAQGIMIDGITAWFLVNCTFMVI